MKTILLVSSDMAFSTAMSSLLSATGHEVLVSDPGERALSLFHERGIRTDAIVLDLQFATESAIRMVHFVKSDPFLKQVPVLVCSGSNANDVVEAQRAGADDYVQKTVSFKIFLFRLSILLSRYEVTHENANILESHRGTAHLQRGRKYPRTGAVHSGTGLALAGAHR